MADVTVEDVFESLLKLSTAEQAQLLTRGMDVLRQKLEAQEAEAGEKPFPSLASNLYEIAQDLEKNPPDGRPIPGKS